VKCEEKAEKSAADKVRCFFLNMAAAIFMNSPGKPGLFTSRGCRRCKAQGMKLWSFTANPLQQSRWGKIGLPGG